MVPVADVSDSSMWWHDPDQIRVWSIPEDIGSRDIRRNRHDSDKKYLFYFVVGSMDSGTNMCHVEVRILFVVPRDSTFTRHARYLFWCC